MKHTFLAKVIGISKNFYPVIEGADIRVDLEGDFGKVKINFNEQAAKNFSFGDEFMVTLESSDR